MEKYKESLEGDALARYVHKIRVINDVDPYTMDMKSMDYDRCALPDVEYADIVNYCLFKMSAYTLKELKSFKSLDAYNQVVSGWVSGICSATVNGYIVVRAKVRHSQSMNKPPLQPWIIAEKSGDVLFGHCDCMAGLGETCTHVSALLFGIDAEVRRAKSVTVTGVASYWMLPGNVDKVPFAEARDINFTSSKKMKKDLDSSLNNTPISQRARKRMPVVEQLSDERFSKACQELFTSNTRSAILTILPDFSDSFVPKCDSPEYPWISSNLKDSDCTYATKEQLVEICERLLETSVFDVSSTQSELVEKQTRDPSNKRLWHRFRAGRITASNMKRVCQTKHEKPAISTIKSVCYPNIAPFQTAATKWGCEHESVALKQYKDSMTGIHENFQVFPSGFIISTDCSLIGATPDAISVCDCCGKGCVEIKCPFCDKDKDVVDFAQRKNSSLENSNGSLHVKKNHSHYYQCQTQMYVTETDFCHYVVWSNQGIHVERLEPDAEVVDEIVRKSKLFFQHAVLPELLGGVFSKPDPHPVHRAIPTHSANCPPSTSSADVVIPTPVVVRTSSPIPSEVHTNDNGSSPVPPPVSTSLQKLLCYCKTPYDETKDYIGCDGEVCDKEWFHIKCAKVKKIPAGKWFCKECRKENGQKKRKVKK